MLWNQLLPWLWHDGRALATFKNAVVMTSKLGTMIAANTFATMPEKTLYQSGTYTVCARQSQSLFPLLHHVQHPLCMWNSSPIVIFRISSMVQTTEGRVVVQCMTTYSALSIKGSPIHVKKTSLRSGYTAKHRKQQCCPAASITICILPRVSQNLGLPNIPNTQTEHWIGGIPFYDSNICNLEAVSICRSPHARYV